MAAEEMTTIRKEGGLDETADVVVQISNDDTSASVDLQYFAVKVSSFNTSHSSAYALLLRRRTRLMKQLH